jgi:methionyl-tRNA formyltransferase
MKILYYGYRDWSFNIYKLLVDKFPEHQILLSSSKEMVDLNSIESFKPDLILFYGWSWKIKLEIINKYFCVCLHPSKLPEYRGGSPIQNQLINSVEESAVTLFKMNNFLDQGEILEQETFSLDGYLDDIFNRVEQIGFRLTHTFIEKFKSGTFEMRIQDENLATVYKRRTPEQSEIKIEDFTNHESKYFYNMVRGLQKPYPEVYIKCKDGTKLILLKVEYE